jgi:cytoskeleton-associated protein 5
MDKVIYHHFHQLKKRPPVPSGSAPPATSAKKVNVAAPAPPKAAKTTAQPGTLDTFKYKHTPEDAEALATELIPPSFLADLGDANWKTRLAALEEMSTWLESVVEGVDAEVVVRALAKKGWSEKNFQVSLGSVMLFNVSAPFDPLERFLQVSAKLYGILSILAERCPSFGRSCPALCVGHLSEKLGDTKLKKPAGDTLLVFAEKTSLQFILCQGSSIL